MVDETKVKEPQAQQPQQQASKQDEDFKFNWGDAGAIGEGSLDGFNHSNSQPVPTYKKTSDGQTEFTGPLTVEALRKLEQAIIQRGIKDPLLKNSEFEILTKEIDSIGQNIIISPIGSGDRGFASDATRFIIQSELSADGKYVPSKLIVGQYENNPLSEDKKGVEIGKKLGGSEDTVNEIFGKLINVTSIRDLNNGQYYNIAAGATFRPGEAMVLTPSKENQSAIVIPLSPEGHLLQPEANALASKTKELEQLLNINQPQKSGTATVELYYADGGNDRIVTISNRMNRNFMNIIENPTPDTIKEYGASMSEDRLRELDAAIDSGRFSRALTVTETDAAGKETSRILLGDSKPAASVDKLTGMPVTNIVFTQSFNLENGKTSVLESPITLPVSEGHMRQENIDEVVKQVRDAVEKNQISQLAPKGKNPEFDALLKDADKVVLGYDNGAPNVPMAVEKKKLAGVAS